MKTKIFPFVAIVAIAMLPLTAVGLRDPNYGQSQQPLEAEGAQVESLGPVSVLEEELVELQEPITEETSFVSEESAIQEPSSEPAPSPAPEPSQEPSPQPSEPEVLGASTVRETADEHLRLSKEISALHASAENNEATGARLSQFENRLSEMGVILVVFAFILFFFGIFAEVRYAKISRFMTSIGKRFSLKKKHR